MIYTKQAQVCPNSLFFFWGGKAVTGRLYITKCWFIFVPEIILPSDSELGEWLSCFTRRAGSLCAWTRLAYSRTLAKNSQRFTQEYSTTSTPSPSFDRIYIYIYIYMCRLGIWSSKDVTDIPPESIFDSFFLLIFLKTPFHRPTLQHFNLISYSLRPLRFIFVVFFKVEFPRPILQMLASTCHTTPCSVSLDFKCSRDAIVSFSSSGFWWVFF